MFFLQTVISALLMKDKSIPAVFVTVKYPFTKCMVKCSNNSLFY